MSERRRYCEEEEPEEEEVEEKESGNTNALLFARLMKSRTVFISDEITKKLADRVMKELLILEAESNDPIKIFIDSPGGDVDAGFAIFDMIRFIQPKVKMICAGLAASAGALILLASDKKERYGLLNSRYLIHQPSSGMTGDATDIQIQAQEMQKLRDRLNEVIAEETGQTVSQVEKDTDRDNWMSAEEAKKYGLIHKVLKSSKEL